MDDKPGIPMCQKCLQEKRRDIGTLSVAAVDGVRLKDFVHCQHHGNYPIDEMWALRDQGFIGQWIIDPAQYETPRSTSDQEACPPASSSEST